MRISAKTEYACKSVLELAKHWPKKDPLPIAVIAQNQNIPVKFLTQILVQLKSMGLVESVRGQKGGYNLVKSPREISIRDVVEGFSEPAFSKTKNRKAHHILSAVWMKAQEEFLESLQQVNFEDLAKQEVNMGSVPMYTI